ncbi:MAG: hypothetical protein ACKVP0_13160 [Pirellulaceae bacterium]
MASREGQGMQIAVILFAILTVVLAVTTYIYYAAAETKEKERVEAREAEKVATSAQNKANYQATALKFMLGIVKTRKEVEDAKGRAGGGEDTDVNAWLAQYDKDMALYGTAATETNQNYIDLPGYLVSSISRKNQSVVRSGAETASETAAKIAQFAAEQQKREEAEAGQKKAEADYVAARNIFAESQTTTTKASTDALAVYAAGTAKAKKDLENKQAEFDAISGSLAKERNVKEQFASKVAELQSIQGVNIDNPDATIIWINQKQRLVWIDRGFDDGLGRQMSFAVYSQNTASLFKQVERMRKEGTGKEKVKKLESKGRIEVVRVTGPHEAECRILEDKASDPILPGDWIHSPAWSPGQRLHFALVGFMDIDGDQQSDRETIKHIITMNGGVIDTEIRDDGVRDEGKMTVNTRYVVTGDASEKGNLAIKNLDQYQKTRTAFFNEMTQFAVEKISVQQLLDMMGWKPEEKTVGLGGVMDSGFSKRTPSTKAPPAAPPGGTAPAAEPPAADEPAEGAPKAGGKKKTEPADAADPFGGK